MAVAVAWQVWRPGTVTSLGEPFAQIQPLTFTAGVSRANISPDGQWIAYARRATLGRQPAPNRFGR